MQHVYSSLPFENSRCYKWHIWMASFLHVKCNMSIHMTFPSKYVITDFTFERFLSFMNQCNMCIQELLSFMNLCNMFSQNLFSHLHDGKELFQCEIAVFKLLLQHIMEERNLIVFSKHTLAVHDGKKPFICNICDYCCFWVLIKTHKKHEKKETSQFLSKHTCSSWRKEAIPMWQLWLLLFSNVT